MNIKNYIKGKEDIVAKTLIGIAVIFGAMIMLKAGAVYGDLFKAKKAVKNAAEQVTLKPEQSKKNLNGPKALAEELKKKNLFSPPAAKQKSVEQITGIFGNEALINGKWYKVGDKIQDAEILTIDPTKVIVRIDGKEKSFLPIISTSSQGSEGQAQETSSGQQSRRFEGPGDRGMGDRGGSDRGGFRGPTPEEIEKFRNMTDEQKREFRDQMRERFRR